MVFLFFFSRVVSVFYNVFRRSGKAATRRCFLWVVARCGYTACLLCAARFALGLVQGDPEAAGRQQRRNMRAELRRSESESPSLSR